MYGGFVATNSREVKEYLKFYSPSCTFSNALSPLQVATVSKALEIVRAPEGQMLRDKLMHNILSLRQHLADLDLEVYGEPSAIVCVKTGDEALARMTSRELPELGLISNLVEFPAVAKGEARFRLQVMARHSEAQLRAAAQRMRTAVDIARRRLQAGIDQPVASEIALAS